MVSEVIKPVINDLDTGEAFLCLPVFLERENAIQKAYMCCVAENALVNMEEVAFFYLHKNERSYFDGLTVEKRRREYLMGRLAAKEALRCYFEGRKACEIEIRPGVFQQPVVMLEMKEPIEICITHMGTMAIAMAFPSGHPIGIDMEQVKPDNLKILSAQVDLAELPATDFLPNRPEAITRAWSVKEALSKILRCGLTVPFSLLQLKADWDLKGSDAKGDFENFYQYGFLSMASRYSCFSMVHPRRTIIQFDRDKLIGFLLENEKPPIR